MKEYMLFVYGKSIFFPRGPRWVQHRDIYSFDQLKREFMDVVNENRPGREKTKMEVMVVRNHRVTRITKFSKSPITGKWERD